MNRSTSPSVSSFNTSRHLLHPVTSPLLTALTVLLLWLLPGFLSDTGAAGLYAQQRKKGSTGASASKKKVTTMSKAREKKPSKKIAVKKGASKKELSKKKVTTTKGIVRSTEPAKKREAVRTPKPAPIPVEQLILPDSTFVEDLAEGVAHRWVRTANKQIVNIITIDLKTNARLSSYKGFDRYDGLERASDIGRRAGENRPDTVIAAANASFWRAGTNSPIGATITQGEVIEMPGYKQWSSLLIYEDGSAAIDRISIRGRFVWRGRASAIERVNSRYSETGIILYNGYYGDSLPRGSRKSDSAIVAEAVANQVDSETDDTESSTIDTAALIRDYRTAKLLEDREHSMLKIACRFPASRRKKDPAIGPQIDDTMKLIVTAVDTGVVAVPENGYVLSLGDKAEWYTTVQIGDTVSVLYIISPDQPKRVRHALTGTPRIVRDGHAEPEQEIEGSKARRFVRGDLARTAVGISRGGDTLFLVTVNSSSKSKGTIGMNLVHLAAFMESIGAYNAINFDGGGSASMAINGTMISLQGTSPTSRRVSNALVVVKEAKGKRKRALPSP